MKKPQMLLLAIALMSYGCAKGPQSQLLGVWQPESVAGQKMSENEKEASVEFREDGSCVLADHNERTPCLWRANDDWSELTITGMGKTTFTLKWKLEKLDVGTMAITEQNRPDEKIILKKRAAN